MFGLCRWFLRSLSRRQAFVVVGLAMVKNDVVQSCEVVYRKASAVDDLAIGGWPPCGILDWFCNANGKEVVVVVAESETTNGDEDTLR
mmetsp:Transcript_10886/g.17147  ORF Transcript_10886/g.17147 Transcript_10886/m.17147 type:complete len:88 (-) Transcript_10886:390-653(-)